MTTIVHLRFYEELNDFLPEADRKRRFGYTIEGKLTVQDLLERLGVPPSKVELVLVDGSSVNLTHTPQQGECISFYPMFESFDIRPVLRVRADPLRDVRFATAAGLRPLARYLRLCGFDTLDRGSLPLLETARLSEAEGRILLVHQGGPLPGGHVSHLLRLQKGKPRQQLLEIIEALDLVASASPLTRCPVCNHSLRTAEVTAVPPGDLSSNIQTQCEGCGCRISEGPHVRRVRWFLRQVLAARGAPS